MLCNVLTTVTLLAALATAQTSTLCNPLNTTCPSDPALGTTYADSFNTTAAGLNTHFWTMQAGSDLAAMGPQGTTYTLSSSGQSVTAQSTFYIFWGSVSVVMRAAPGVGIISTIILLSDDLDEVDWEIMGGNGTHVESNWYGQGNTTQRNAQYFPCEGPETQFHNYTISWTPTQTQWILDGAVQRTLPRAAPGMYPQTPSQVKMGVWAGGDKSEPVGVQQWAGGVTDWSKGPFAMVIQSVSITDGSTNTTSYSYGDKSGSADSIVSTGGRSKAAKAVQNPSAFGSAGSAIASLSQTAKIAIGASVAGVVALLAIVFCFCCLRARKAGKRERMFEEAKWERENAEMAAYKNQMASGKFATASVQSMPGGRY